MGFTWERPFPGMDSEQLAHRKDTRAVWKIPSTSPSLLSKVKHNVFHSRSKSSVASSQPSQNHQALLGPFPFLLLPREIREHIYGHVIGGKEKLHILRKHRAARKPAAIGYRGCRASNENSCRSGKCRELGINVDEYCGWFDGCMDLLLVCKQM